MSISIPFTGMTRDKMASIINDSWCYSWHWPKDSEYGWRKQALEDCESRITYVNNDLNKLKEAREQLKAELERFKE